MEANNLLSSSWILAQKRLFHCHNVAMYYPEADETLCQEECAQEKWQVWTGERAVSIAKDAFDDNNEAAAATADDKQCLFSVWNESTSD